MCQVPSSDAGPTRHLSELYSVVAALALTVAVGRLFESRPSAPGIAWELLPALLAFLLILVPFYHGALRYLDDTYGGGRTPRDARVLWDRGCLFIEACVLVGAAYLVVDPQRLALALATLWLVDLAWIGFGRFLGLKAPAAWARINLVAIPCLIGVWAVGNLAVGSLLLGGVLALVAALRSIADYAWSWPFYFPDVTGAAPGKV